MTIALHIQIYEDKNSTAVFAGVYYGISYYSPIAVEPIRKDCSRKLQSSPAGKTDTPAVNPLLQAPVSYVPYRIVSLPEYGNIRLSKTQC